MMPGVVAGFPRGPQIQPTTHVMTVGSLNSGTFWGYTKGNVPQLGTFSPEALAVPGYSMLVYGIYWNEYADANERLILSIRESPLASPQFSRLSSLRSVEIAGVEFRMTDAVKYTASGVEYVFGWPSTNILGPTVGASKTVKFNYF